MQKTTTKKYSSQQNTKNTKHKREFLKTQRPTKQKSHKPLNIKTKQNTKQI